jgi:hypothetical protein
MARITKNEIKDRCQKAVTDFQIPVSSINKLYALLEQGVKDGKSDDDLRQIVAEFVAVAKADADRLHGRNRRLG